MTHSIAHSKLSVVGFLPMHTVRVIERTVVVQQKEGVTTRILTEIVLVEVNQNLVAELMRENQQLKQEYQEDNNRLSDVIDILTVFGCLIMVLYKMYGQSS